MVKSLQTLTCWNENAQVEPPHFAPRRIEYVDERVSQPYVVRSYVAPERNSGDQRPAAALALLADILGDGQASVSTA